MVNPAADGLEEFRLFLEERLVGDAGGALPVPALSLDGALTCGAATRELVEVLERVGPFGAGNPRPRFAFAALRIAYAEPVGTDHVRVRLADAAGGLALNAIAFRAAATELGRALLGARGGAVHVAGTLRLDDWQGRQGLQLAIEDAARP